MPAGSIRFKVIMLSLKELSLATLATHVSYFFSSNNPNGFSWHPKTRAFFYFRPSSYDLCFIALSTVVHQEYESCLHALRFSLCK